MARLSPLQTPGKKFAVGVIGVGEKGLEILQGVFNTTRCDLRSYELIAVNDVSSPESMVALKAADIFLINVNNPQAVLAWRRFQMELPSEKRRPVLQLNQHPSPLQSSECTLQWPLDAATLLTTLDNYILRYLDYPTGFATGAAIQRADASPHSQVASSDIGIQESPAAYGNAPCAKASARVLVADDSLAVRRQMKIEFDSINVGLECVADGDAAVAAAGRQTFDLIFLDVVMPGLDGYAACRLIKRSSFNRLTPIIMLTSRSSRFDQLKGVLAGCDTYLTKPINHQEFRDIADKHLGKKD